jgi:hypothetical protein
VDGSVSPSGSRITSVEIERKIVHSVPISPMDGKDFEDVLHLYLTFEVEFNFERLESYVEQLGVEDYYAELRRI